MANTLNKNLNKIFNDLDFVKLDTQYDFENTIRNDNAPLY